MNVRIPTYLLSCLISSNCKWWIKSCVLYDEKCYNKQLRESLGMGLDTSLELFFWKLVTPIILKANILSQFAYFSIYNLIASFIHKITPVLCKK